MNREEAKRLLGENATDEQVTNLLNTIHTEISAKDNEIKSLNEKITNGQSELEKLRKSDLELQKIKESQMTEQEKAKALQEQLNAKMSEYQRLTNSAKAKSILVGAGISSERADSLVSKFVRDDEAATLDLANDFVSEFNAVKEQTEKKVKDEMANIDPTPKGSNVNPKADDNIMTFEKFNNLSAEEQDKFATEHPDEFAKF